MAADWEILDVVGTEEEAELICGYLQNQGVPCQMESAHSHEFPVNVSALVHRIAGVETRLPIHVAEGPDCQIRADPDQLEQLLINLVHNASDAALQTGGSVTVGWKREGRGLELWIDDEGAGLTNASNLFVPFFTTKPTGSGIGLVLSRQIAEAHGGTLTLDNRGDRQGCRAYLRLPV